jgi:dipeptidase E
MKLLLTSSGFTTQEIVDECVRLVGKPASKISVAVINEAYAPEGEDHSWVVEELNTIKQTLGGTFILVNLLALDAQAITERIAKCDVVYVVGGHTDYLMSVFNKSGFTNSLKEIANTKLYIGSSAGSMVVCGRVSTDNYIAEFEERGTYGITEYAMLVDFALKPHLNSPDFPDRTVNKLKRAAHGYTGTLYCLSDSSALSVNDDSVKVIGKDWIKFVDGVLQ